MKQDGDLIEAHLLTASMDLEEGQLDDAEKALDRAMRVVTKEKLPPLEVYTLRASLEMSRGNNPDQWIKRILDYNPRYGAMYQQLAHFEIMRRRYKEATVLLRRAVEVQPDLWAAHAELGSNLLRLGNVDEARTHLQAAYSGDPYSPTTVNSLRLLDRIDEFSISEDPVVIGQDTYQVRLRLHKKESEVLRPYVLDLTSRSIQSFSQRYGFKPREPITVELYPDHDDFAVRVAALPGIGLLGVTFGYVVAMDSPSSRPTERVSLGQHAVARDGARIHVGSYRPLRAALVERRHLGVRRMAHRPDAGRRGAAGRHRGARRNNSCRSPISIPVSFARAIPARCRCRTCSRAWCACSSSSAGASSNSAHCCRQYDGKRTTAQAIEATFKIAPAAFDKEFDAFVRDSL